MLRRPQSAVVQTTVTSNNPWLECRVSDLYHSHTALEPVGQVGGCWRALGRGLRAEEDSQAASETGAGGQQQRGEG